MQIAGLTQYLVTYWEGSTRHSYQVGAFSKEGLARHLKKVYSRFKIDIL